MWTLSTDTDVETGFVQNWNGSWVAEGGFKFRLASWQGLFPLYHTASVGAVPMPFITTCLQDLTLSWCRKPLKKEHIKKQSLDTLSTIIVQCQCSLSKQPIYDSLIIRPERTAWKPVEMKGSDHQKSTVWGLLCSILWIQLKVSESYKFNLCPLS